MEKVYQYLWKSKMFGRKLHEADGRVVEVIDPGKLNTDSGPDFFNSKIKIDGLEWIGNIEVHIKASDWFRHGHDSDPAYDSVILHVVGISDKRITRRDGSLIPQVELTVPEDFFAEFAELSEGNSDFRCARRLGELSPLAVSDWLESLAIERLQEKAMHITDIYKSVNCNWEQTCFITLARALGFGLNGEPFELLARSIPLNFILRHSDNPLQIQAILFGQGAMLDSSLHPGDEYYQALCREYYFLARKYSLRPMRPGLWKYSRTRPQNFPHRRIALLAKLCEGGFALFSDILSSLGDIEKLRGKFDISLTGYWASHSSFQSEASSPSTSLSTSSIDILIINAAVPLAYAYSCHSGDYDKVEKCIDLIDSLPPEKNYVTRNWANAGLVSDSALRSQAIIHLTRNYCEPRKCLYCRFGHQVLKAAATQ